MLRKRLALVLILMIMLSTTTTYGKNIFDKASSSKVGVNVTGSDREKNDDNYTIDDAKLQKQKGNPFKAKYHRVENTEQTNSTEIKVSNSLVSMTEARVIDVEFNLGYKPDLTQIRWTFGGLPFSNWKKWDSLKKNYAGEPFITFFQTPYLDGSTVKASIKFDLVYGTEDLSLRPIRVLYPALIGLYDLTAVDTSTGAAAQKAMKLNVYDSYHTYDELKPAIDEIFANARKDRYLEYQSIGKSVEGRDFHFIILAKDKGSVNKYLNETVPLMLENPGLLQKKIDNGTAGDFKVPVFINNIHPDEAPGIDAQLDTLRLLAASDTIEYMTTDGNNREVKVKLNVSELLNDVIFVMNLTENPDGRYYNTRYNVNGFDVNRDNGYQTQIESQTVVKQIVKWNPISFLDLHGFVKGFLLEPCTPPHEPNYEYDLLIENMLKQAEAMGKAGIANTRYDSFVIPYNDYASGWDDGAPAYTATYAMHHGAMGHTIEIPELNQHSVNALKYAILASAKFVSDNKNELFKNQLEYYRRGIEGIDSRSVDPWLVNAAGTPVGRPRGDNENFFPEYYALPVDGSLQKNSLEVYNTVKYLLRNGVKVQKTVKPVKVGDVTYPAGTFVVDMHQAKRGYANMVLYSGYDASDFPEMYAEIVMNFPSLRGFDAYEVRTARAFAGSVENAASVKVPSTKITGDAENYIIKNANNDAVRAVNKLLSEGKKVSMVKEKGENYNVGDYLVSRADLVGIRKEYLLETAPLTGKVKSEKLVQPKVAVTGNKEIEFVLKDLGFKLVKDAANCDVVVDDRGKASADIIKAGKSYIGTGRAAIDFVKTKALLTGIDWNSTGWYHEGLLKAELSQDTAITSGYGKNEALYVVDGSYITGIPDGAKVLAKVSSNDDFYIAGWMPKHEMVQGKALAITQKTGSSNITLFANTLTNKAHPQNCYRMLANTIFYSTIK